jgi:hypothetical protein
VFLRDALSSLQLMCFLFCPCLLMHIMQGEGAGVPVGHAAAGAARSDSRPDILLLHCACPPCREKALVFLWDTQQQELHGVFRPDMAAKPLLDAALRGAQVRFV